MSAFNDNAVKNALVLMIAYSTDAASQRSAEILIPLAGGLFILPFFLCSATAGQLADQHDKAWLIRLIKFSEIALMMAAAAGVLLGSTTALLVILFVMGIEAAFLGPLKYAILPDLLAPHELLLGNALVEAGTFIAILLGTIAGVLIAGHHGAMIVAALIIMVALAAWAASLAIPGTSPAAARSPLEWNLFAATGRIIREAAREKILFYSILGISWFWLAGAIYLSQFPAYVRFSLGGEQAVVTLFLTVFTIGIAIGSLLCSRILGGRISARTVPWGALGIALFSIDLWWASPPAVAGGGTLLGLRPFLSSPAHWRILVDLLGIAVSGGIFIVPLYVLLQAASARAQRARAIAANNVINAAAMVIAAVATMALIAVGVSVPGLFLLTGGATLIVAAWFWRLQPSLSIGADQIRGRQEMTEIANDPLSAFRLNGKVALITGGGSGIGRATAAALAGVGAAVAVLDIDPVRAAAAAEEIAALGRPVSSQAADVTDEKSVDAAIDAVAARHGGIDILVNSAGIGIRRAAVELPLAEWDKVVAVNLTGVFLCSRAAARQMMRRGGGAIVNLASIMGFSGGGIYPNVSYQATKGAVVNMTRALAVEWASSGIRVNAVAPTWVRTNLTAPLLDQPGVMERIAALTPMGRLATPEEIAHAILYLASPAAAMVTGHTLAVDGGFLAQ